MDSGGRDRALADLNTAIQLDPLCATACLCRAKVFGYENQFDRFLADLDEAIRLNPKFATAHAARGLLRTWRVENDKPAAAATDEGKSKIKREEELALADFAEAVRLDPKNSSYYGERGALYVACGEIEKGLADLSEAIRLNPKDVQALTARARFTRTAVIRTRPSPTWMRRSRPIHPAPRPAFLGAASTPTGASLTAALPTWTKRSASIRSWPRPMPPAAPCECQAERDVYDARTDWNNFSSAYPPARSAATFPDYGTPGRTPAGCAGYPSSTAFPGSLPEGTVLGQLPPPPALPAPPDILPEAAALGQQPSPKAVQESQERKERLEGKVKHEREQALADLDEAIRLDPKVAWYYKSRGQVYAEKGDLDKAIADLTEAIRLDPKFSEAYEGRAKLYAWKHETEKAVADYAQAARLRPEENRSR